VTSEWLPAATLGAGVIGTIGAQGLTAWFASKREEGARAAERQVAREAFQRDTLLELQDAVLEMVRVATKLYISHRTVFAQTGEYARTPDPADLDEAARTSMALVAKLGQRVVDDELRGAITALQTRCGEVVAPNFGDDDAQAKTQATRRWSALVFANTAFNDHLGSVLRRVL
jgi:hypothetical protein